MQAKGPNAPCECGSGKKFKKCCGRPKPPLPPVPLPSRRRSASLLPIITMFAAQGAEMLEQSGGMPTDEEIRNNRPKEEE